ncbi:MAG: MFS transporter [Alphaproteobacteria bacterium]|nr:MFS transporter [Alphaproteobacteria bacterium]
MRPGRTIVVAALGATQTLAWASSYYLPAILAEPIAAATGVSQTGFFAIFSAALLLSALLGPAVGRRIDRHGGRGVLVASNLFFAAGLASLGMAQGPLALVAAWALLGIGMSVGLYDSAFAALAMLYGSEARGAITGITLIAGLASTIGWPVSAFLDHAIGWRGACFAWAALHILLGLPANRFLIPKARLLEPRPLAPGAAAPTAPRGAMGLLAFVFAATWFVTGAMAAHLPRLLEGAGVSAAAAPLLAGLVGAAQVAARFVEFSVLRWVHPLNSARFAAILHPIGACVLILFGAPAAAAFALLHGAGNGMLTIAKGTLPLALFGPIGYGLRSGILAAPARAAQAAAPLLFGLFLDRLGEGALAVSTALSLAAFLALLGLQPRRAAAAPAVSA